MVDRLVLTGIIFFVKHLYTLTGNLLAETTGSYHSISPGETHRAVGESFQVGGKGINVAKMAQRLGVFSTAVCFPGGHTGERCLSWMRSQAFAVQPFRQASETRSGWVVRTDAGETTFLGADRNLEEEPWVEAMHYFERTLEANDFFAICGSLPGWRSALTKPLGRLLETIAGKVFVAVDTYGAPLEEITRHPVDLVKINREELQSMQVEGGMKNSVVDTLRALAMAKPNVRRWVVTSGGGPVTALEKNRPPVQLDALPVKVVSPVGCGDVLLAGLIQQLAVEGASLEEALRRAMPLAAANAASPGIADFAI